MSTETTATLQRWDSFALVDSEGCAYSMQSKRAEDRLTYARGMREFRDNDACISGLFFDNPEAGRDPSPEAQWAWGPEAADVDFSGLDEAILRDALCSG